MKMQIMFFYIYIWPTSHLVPELHHIIRYDYIVKNYLNHFENNIYPVFAKSVKKLSQIIQ